MAVTALWTRSFAAGSEVVSFGAAPVEPAYVIVSWRSYQLSRAGGRKSPWGDSAMPIE